MAQAKTKANTKKKKIAGGKSQKKKTLLIVESPSKGRVIGKYLGSSYKVMASEGHVRDLPKSRLGVEVENNFEPDYINIRGKGSKIKELKKEAASASKVLLATDPDREGEAISWQLTFLLGIDPTSDCRVTFNEINKDAVKEAIKNPRPIDMGLVDAQQARRVLDRLVGYQISPLLWKKVKRGLSAGRVQSAALKMICDRENEITSFIPEEFWNINVDFDGGFSAKLSKKNAKAIKGLNEKDAKAIEADLNRGEYFISEVKSGKKNSRPYAPFTTSTMQQDASIRINFSTKKTMNIAQQLYEGVDIKGRGTQGLITYHRTDSVRISDQARALAKEYIKDKFGSDYVADNHYKNKNKAAQDAHEAIRPVDVRLSPGEIKDSLSADQYKLYNLVWSRYLASQMSACVHDTMTVKINNGVYQLSAGGSRMIFDGWRKVYKTLSKDGENMLPELKEGEKLIAEKINLEQKFTTPPPRYTEASLVKEMEDKNIGRPSTYASVITTITSRRYIKKEKKNLIPTKLGFDVIAILSEFFSDVVDVKFTGEMEDNLDKVEFKEMEWREVVSDFYVGFEKELEIANKEAEKIEQEVELTDEICEKCGRQMAIKDGRFGKFLACSGYPDCKNTRPIVKTIGVKCPSCGKDILEKKSRRGRIFYGCSGYPECTVSFWDRPVDKKCPVCGSLLLMTKGSTHKLKCSNEDCAYTELIENIENKEEV